MTSTLLVLLVVATAGWLVQSLLARRSERDAADSAADFSRALAALSPDGDGRRRARGPRPAGPAAEATAHPRRSSTPTRTAGRGGGAAGAGRRPARQVVARRR